MMMQYHGAIIAHFPWGSLACKMGTSVRAWPCKIHVAPIQDQEIPLSLSRRIIFITSNHLYHVESSLSRQIIFITPNHLYHAKSSLIITPNHLYHAKSSLSRHIIFITPNHLYHAECYIIVKIQPLFLMCTPLSAYNNTCLCFSHLRTNVLI